VPETGEDEDTARYGARWLPSDVMKDRSYSSTSRTVYRWTDVDATVRSMLDTGESFVDEAPDIDIPPPMEGAQRRWIKAAA